MTPSSAGREAGKLTNTCEPASNLYHEACFLGRRLGRKGARACVFTESGPSSSRPSWHRRPCWCPWQRSSRREDQSPTRSRSRPGGIAPSPRTTPTDSAVPQFSVPSTRGTRKRRRVGRGPLRRRGSAPPRARRSSPPDPEPRRSDQLAGLLEGTDLEEHADRLLAGLSPDHDTPGPACPSLEPDLPDPSERKRLDPGPRTSFDTVASQDDSLGRQEHHRPDPPKHRDELFVPLQRRCRRLRGGVTGRQLRRLRGPVRQRRILPRVCPSPDPTRPITDGRDHRTTDQE